MNTITNTHTGSSYTGLDSLDKNNFEAIRLINNAEQNFVVLQFDMEGRILKANDNLLKVFQYRREEIIGQSYHMLVSPEYAKSGTYAAFWAKLHSGKLFTETVRRWRKDGAEVWIQATYTPILSQEGKPLRYYKIGHLLSNGNMITHKY